MNMYQQIDKNKRETFIIIVLFMAVISTIGWFIGEYYYEGAGVAFLGIAFDIFWHFRFYFLLHIRQNDFKSFPGERG